MITQSVISMAPNCLLSSFVVMALWYIVSYIGLTAFSSESGMVWYGIVEFNVPLDTV